MKHKLHSKMSRAPLPAQGRGLFRKTWAVLLLLATLLSVSQRSWAFSEDISKPKIYTDTGFQLQYEFPNRAQLKFVLGYFNYDGSNGAFDGDVWLRINGKNAVKLNEIMPEITGNKNNENAVKGKDDNFHKVLGYQYFKTDDSFSGYVALANSYTEGQSTKWVRTDVYIMLESVPTWSWRKNIKISVKGNWLYYDKRTDNCEVSTYFSPPSESSLHLPTYTSCERTGNNQVKIVLSDLKADKFPYYNGSKTTQGNWTYSLRFATRANNDKWPDNSDLLKISQVVYSDNTNETVNNYEKSTKAGVTQVTATLQADNYKAFCIYPVVGRTSSKYTMFPGDYSTAVTGNPGFYMFYTTGKWINGYPRPNSAMSLTADPWKKTIELNWTPEVYNKSHCDSIGTWVIFRDGKKIGEVACRSLAQASYTDTNVEEYDKTYTYSVAFQPQGWATIADTADAKGLYRNKTGKIKRDNPITSISATRNLVDKINVTCGFFFPDASAKNYKLILKRRLNSDDQNVWTEIQDFTVRDSAVVSHTFEDTQDILNEYVSYCYTVSVQALGKTWETNSVSGCIKGNNSIEKISASRGSFNGMVRIEWDVTQSGTTPTNFILQRRLLGSTDENDYLTIHTTSGVATKYSYEDATAQAGTYYEYRVKCYREYEGKLYQGATAQTDGFAMATGIINGRISYGTGTVVQDVKVRLEKSSAGGDNIQGFHAMQINEGNSYIKTAPKTDDEFLSLFSNPWTVQMYFKIDTDHSSTMSKRVLFDTNWMFIYVGPDNKITAVLKAPSSTGNGAETQYIKIYNVETKKGVFYSLSLAYNGDNTYDWCLVDDQGNVYTQHTEQTFAYTAATQTLNYEKCIIFGNKYNGAGDMYRGVIDECRLWTRALSEEEIRSNYYRILSGSEDGLYLYYKLDEGIAGQRIAYDYSKKGGVPNGRHGTISTNMKPTTDVPSDDQLAVCGLTDGDGNYTISGVPFSGDGTTYSVIPSMGIHSFTPSKSSRFVSSTSQVHSGVDFSDESSFTTTGKVRYAGTTIPVEGAYVYVDGYVASKDGEPVLTDGNGEFEVDVPIGDHFIQVKKNGHVFANEGRFPEDPGRVGKRHTFEQEERNITFWDSTLVMVAGRVAGGKPEEEKPLGFGLGKANVGKAKITLSFEKSQTCIINAIYDENQHTYINNTEQRNFTANLNSGAAYVEGGKNTVTIETDSKTGEFAVLLPPLFYNVESVTVPNNPEVNLSGSWQLDASSPELVISDSIETEYGTRYFDYVAGKKFIYRSEPTITITENKDGSFGMDSAKVQIDKENTEKIALYTKDNSSGVINYTFGYPIYQMLNRYTYNIYAYEQYKNYDENKDNPEIIEIPLGGTSITFRNPMASTTYVKVNVEDNGVTTSVDSIVANRFELDDEGKAVYQFVAGMPNINDSYCHTLTVAYEVNGKMYYWREADPFKAVILGTIPVGNNFVTEGPDHVEMVLRDPPGSLSNTTISKGTSFSYTRTTSVAGSTDTNVMTNTYLGAEFTTGGGFGVVVLSDTEAKCTTSLGAQYFYKRNDANSVTTTTSFTEDISTSDSPDFVGACGDVFIGTSNNLVFGGCKDVHIEKDFPTNEYILACSDAVTMGETFKTQFATTQNKLENVEIPNWQTLRNNLLETHPDIASVQGYVKESRYVTTLTNDDEDFGAPGTYKWIPPTDKTISAMDMVGYYNSQIARWTKILAENEKAKLTAIRNSEEYKIKNYSFDAGASITNTTETSTTTASTVEFEHELHITLGVETGLKIGGIGLGITATETGSYYNYHSYDNEEETNTSVSYTLKEDGDDDYLTVDVFKAPDGFGPIFVTRAGATCAPYEDEVVTKYYEPGNTISHKTLQIEKPKISITNPVISGVPGGEQAKIDVTLYNQSSTQEDCYFGLRVEPQSNPNGAIVKFEGQSLATWPQLIVPYTENGEEGTKVTLTIEQSNTEVLDYDGIIITMFAPSQPDDTGTFPGIYSSDTVEVHFQPLCSDIALKANTNIVNTETEGQLTFDMSNYDFSMKNLKSLRLQYKGKNDKDFITIREFYKKYEDYENNMSGGGILTECSVEPFQYSFDLRDSRFTNQTYVFRVLTVCTYGTDEVTRSSQEIEVIRDLSRPELLTTPTPQSGVLYPGDDISITFNEPIRQDLFTKDNNFTVLGVKNEGEVAHSVALSINDKSQSRTEASIDLEGKSFALALWLKYTSDGTLLQHGTKDNSLKLSTEDGRLVVSMNGQTIKSDTEMPKDKWFYLMLSLTQDGDTPCLNANYTIDDREETLIAKADAGFYSGNGQLAIGGEGMTGAIQELTLWDKNLTLPELQSRMHTVKSNCTEGLAGYWRFDEGHGSKATDLVRSRHFYLDSESAWWKNFTNYSLALGQNSGNDNAANVRLDGIGLNDDDDFVLETWMRADSNQKDGDIFILHNQPALLSLRLDSENHLVFDYSIYTAEVTKTSIADDQWHHIALAVNKSNNGMAKVYVDGQLCTQVPSEYINATAVGHLNIGYANKPDFTMNDDGQIIGKDWINTPALNGYIDELRIWKGQRSASVINDWMYKRATGNEDNLILHLPFEADSLNSSSRTVTYPILYSTVDPDKQDITASDYDTLTTTKDKSPALSEPELLENIAYSFVANDKQIVFRLEEKDADIEDRTVTFTVRNVRDLNGNTNQPVTWSVLVKRANLLWEKDEVSVQQPEGEPTSFDVMIRNTGITTENWVLSDIPSWLDVSAESGSLPAVKDQTLRFTTVDGTAIGKYEATIMLIGSQGIKKPLHISLRVNGETPDWATTRGENTMNIVAQLKVDGIVSSDSDDILAAFNGDKCVGVAQPKYMAKYDSYLVMMDVYSTTGNQDNTLTYKMYDASTGTIYPLVTSSDTRTQTFEVDTWIGSFASPVVFSPENKIEQVIALADDDWKWFSLYAQPDDNTTQGFFAPVEGKVELIKTQTESSIYNESGWMGAITSLNFAEMYKQKSINAYSMSFIGAPAEDANVSLTINSGWSWIGYPCSIANSPDDALAGANPVEGDLIKGQSGFSLYTDNRWVGSLRMLTPGEGYQYFSNASSSKTFRLPTIKRSTSSRAAARRMEEEETLDLRYENNMTVIAEIKDGDFDITDAKISIYSGGILRGQSSAPVVDGKYFITIGGGSSRDLLDIVVERPSGDTHLVQTLTFEADKHLGSIDNAIVLQLDGATAIAQLLGETSEIAHIELYDIAGRLITKTTDVKSLLTDDLIDTHSANAYNVKVTYLSGETKTVKIIL